MEEIKEKLAELELLIAQYREEVKDNIFISDAHRNISQAVTALETQH